MSIPTYDQFIEPLLRILNQNSDGLRTSDVYELAAQAAGLSEEDKAKLLPSGRQQIYKNRVGWAYDRLKRVGFARNPQRGYWMLTEAGQQFINQYPSKVPDSEIEAIADAENTPGVNGDEQPLSLSKSASPISIMSPDERIEEALIEISSSVSSELLELIHQSTPAFFEKLVLDLLHSMGYGISRESLQAIGGVGDGGIDGIISLDRLGLDKIYVQAKRWQDNVGRPQIQAFFGAIAGRNATKGVFITTSGFTREAKEYAERVSGSLVLVDGQRLAELMILHGVGVSHKTLRIAKVDRDYFEDV